MSCEAGDPLLEPPAKVSTQMPLVVDLLPDIRDVIISVQKVQKSNRATFTMREIDQVPDSVAFVWSQGSVNVQLFVHTFIEKLSGNYVQNFLHKKRLISTLQAVEHVYAKVLAMQKPAQLFNAFEYYHAWLFSSDYKECPVEVSTIAKLLNCFAWMTIVSYPTHARGIETARPCWAELLSQPPEPTMECLKVLYYGDGMKEQAKKGIDHDKMDPPNVLFDPIDISPEWFTLGYPVDVYCRWCFQKSEPNQWVTDRLMGEFNFFLTMVIARLKNDLDIVGTIQTKIMGAIATLAFAGISRAMNQSEGKEDTD